MPLPPSDEQQRPAEEEPDTVTARPPIENVRALWLTEARLLYGGARLKDLLARRRGLPGDTRGCHA